MTRPLRSFSVIAACLLVVGCGACQEDEYLVVVDDVPIEPRGSAQILFEGAATTYDDYLDCVVDPALCREERLSISDAMRDGNRVGFVLLTNHGNARLFLSDDLGATWRNEEIHTPYDTQIYNRFSTAYGLHLGNGKVWLAAPSKNGEVYVTRVFPYPYAASNTTLMLDSSRFYAEGTSLIQVYRFVMTPYVTLGWQRYDLTTMTALGGRSISGNSLPYSLGDDWKTTDRVRFSSYSANWAFTGQSQQACLITVNASNEADPVPSCVSRLAWPEPLSLSGGTVFEWPTPRGLMQVWDYDGVIWASAIHPGNPPSIEPPLYVGSGRLVEDGAEQGRGRFGDLILLAPGNDSSDAWGLNRLRRIPESGPVVEVRLPKTPCDEGAYCGYPLGTGYGQIARAIPLPAGEWLVFYILDQADQGNHYVLVVDRVREETVSVPYDGPRPVIPALPRAELPTTELARQCIRAVSCAADQYTTVNGCMTYWMEVRTADPSQDALYQQFLATGPGCDGFRTTYPLAFPNYMAGCHGTVGVTGATFSVDCRTYGTPCRTSPWNRGGCSDLPIEELECGRCDSRGRAVDCRAFGDDVVTYVHDCAAFGLECVDRAEQVHPSTRLPRCSHGRCPMGYLTACEDGLAMRCSEQMIESMQDCTRAGLACVEDVGCDFGNWEECPLAREGPACYGDLLAYCLGNKTHYVDCKELGLSKCEQKRCVP